MVVHSSLSSESIVFFDGVCSLCNWSVDFLISIDKRQQLRYAALQGETARTVLDDDILKNVVPDTIVYLEKGRVFVESDAVLRIASRIGGLWRLSAVGFAIPAFLRNRIYRCIARNRYRWFGKKETCRLPTLGERKLFLP